MNHDIQNLQIIVLLTIFIIGLLATVVYYFARYYFKTHAEDREVVPSLKDEPIEVPPSVVEPQPKALEEALAKTKDSLFGRIRRSLTGRTSLSAADLEQVEEVLYTSDLGPTTVQRLLEAVQSRMDGSMNLENMRLALKDEMLSIFSNIKELDVDRDLVSSIDQRHDKPVVWMVVGVNGVGKTTTIGKLASKVAQAGKSVLVVAGDTFRAAAGDQLKVWSERAQVEIFSPPGVTDPSAVAFDGCQTAKAKNIDVVIIDTAGRLHTQSNLMEELKKMKRVIAKVLPTAPHETILVLDANSGQNALVQAKTFNEALDLTGVILTKLDGTAKGGVAVSLACELALPIRMIGVGEGLEDLRPFQTKEFVDSII